MLSAECVFIFIADVADVLALVFHSVHKKSEVSFQ